MTTTAIPLALFCVFAFNFNVACVAMFRFLWPMLVHMACKRNSQTTSKGACSHSREKITGTTNPWRSGLQSELMKIRIIWKWQYCLPLLSRLQTTVIMQTPVLLLSQLSSSGMLLYHRFPLFVYRSKRLQTGANKVFLSESSEKLTFVISMNSKFKMFHREFANQICDECGVTFFSSVYLADK